MAMKKILTKDQSLLGASLYLNSYKRVIEELVYNSLDAESSSIAIRVCINNNVIQVLDNGTGITENNFTLLGQKHVTSKLSCANSFKSKSGSYGYKGMSLAYIIKISKNVKISSKCNSSQNTWLKIFCDGVSEQFCLTTSRPSRGTTVEISGFLYNLNIQRKSINSINELNNIKKFLEQVSLVHCNVSLSLRDDSKDEIIFKIHKNRDIYQTLSSLFEISRNDIQHLEVEKNQYKVKAYISKNNLISLNYHWIYVNGRIVFKSMLHKKVNETLSKKLLNKNTNKKIKEKHNFVDGNIFLNNKIPFYFIFVLCPNIDFDICYNNQQTHIEFNNWDDINILIDKLIIFYFGDIMPKFVKDKKIMESNRKEKNDTRNKVKEIIEKILNKEKNDKISQLLNGVKGKQIKRKNKIKRDNTLGNLCGDSDFIDFTKSKEKVHKKNAKTNKLIINVVDKKPKTEISIQLNNNTKCDKTITKRHPKHVFTKTLVRKFENPKDSIKRRCKQLSNEVQNLLDVEYCKKHERHEKNIFENITFNNSSITAFHIEPNLTLRGSNQISKNILSQKQTRILYSNSNVKKNIKKSYDLVKAELKEIPQFIQENILSRQNTRECYFSHQSAYPHSTFNSHVGNNERYNKKNQNFFHQISHRHCSSILNKTIHKEKYLKNNTHTKLNILKTAIFNEHNNKLYNELDSNNDINNYNETIETQINEFINDKNIKPKNNINCDLVTACNKYFGSENTYTIDILNSLQNANDEVNKTCSVHMTAKFIYNKPKEATPFLSENYINLREDMDVNLNSTYKNLEENINFMKDIPKKLDTISEFQISDRLEPIRFSEAILHSDELREVEKVFDISYFDNINNALNHRSNDNLHHDDEIKHISQYFSNHEESNIRNYKNTTEQIVNRTGKEPNDNHQSRNSIENIHQTQRELLKVNNNVGDFKINSRHSFVPKGMSQIFENKHNKNIEFYNIDDEYYEDVIYKEFAENILEKFDMFGPNVKNLNVQKEFNKIKHKVNKDTSNLIFDSESLEHAKILGQVDRKFIAAKITGRFSKNGKAEFLTLFDQHAVDERISLEHNLSEYFDGTKWKSVPLEALTIKITEENYIYLYNYNEKFTDFGFVYTFGDKEVIVHAIPKALLGKNHRKIEVIFEAVKNFISEQINSIKTLKGNVSLYPKSIMELVFSEACRYAIKFGDRLSNNDCENMIQTLAKCKIPFQCAHGRPVMAVIMELSNNFQHYTVNLKRIKKFKNNIFTK